jgi:hypothetical protein
MSDDKKPAAPLAMMSLTPPFTIMKGEKIVASLTSGEYILMDRGQFDEFVTEYLKLKGAAE